MTEQLRLSPSGPYVEVITPADLVLLGSTIVNRDIALNAGAVQLGAKAPLCTFSVGAGGAVAGDRVVCWGRSKIENTQDTATRTATLNLSITQGAVPVLTDFDTIELDIAQSSAAPLDARIVTLMGAVTVSSAENLAISIQAAGDGDLSAVALRTKLVTFILRNA